MLSVAVSLVLNPLTDIVIARDTFPDSIAVLDPIDPFSIVGVAVHPSVKPLAADLSLLVVAQVLVPITETFVSLSVPLVVCPLAFVNATDLIHADAIAMAHRVFQLATVQRFLVTFDGEV